MKKSKLLEFKSLSVFENANSPSCSLLADFASNIDSFDIFLAPLQSNSETQNEQGIRAICCLLISGLLFIFFFAFYFLSYLFLDSFKLKFVSYNGIEKICKLLYSNDINISTHAVGAVGNLFMMQSLRDQHMSDSILLALFRILCSSSDPYQQKIILRTLTIIASQCKFFSFFLFCLLIFKIIAPRWAETICSHPQFKELKEIEITGSDKSVRQQIDALYELLSSLVSQEGSFFFLLLVRFITLLTKKKVADSAGLKSQNMKVETVYYRPRFLGYKIV